MACIMLPLSLSLTHNASKSVISLVPIVGSIFCSHSSQLPPFIVFSPSLSSIHRSLFLHNQIQLPSFCGRFCVGRLCIGMCFLTMKLKCREISRLDMRARAGVALLGSGFLMLDGTHVYPSSKTSCGVCCKNIVEIYECHILGLLSGTFCSLLVPYACTRLQFCSQH
jgi:hypothetical protein